MAKVTHKANSKNSSTSSRAEKKVEEAPQVMHSERMMETHPYSFANVVRFLSNNFGLLVIGAGLFIFGFVFGSLSTENKALRAGGVGTNPTGQAQQAPQEAQPLSDADWKEIQKNPVFTIGDKNAKVTMVEFTDYQCPFCGQYFKNTHKDVVEKYVKAGKLKIVYKDQALPFHPNANSAAQAVRCAVEQNKAEAMHDALFGNQEVWTPLSGDDVYKKYQELADKAGLNGQKLADCTKSGKYKDAVEKDGQLGSKVGAGGTPTFFIDGKPLVGAQPFSAFDAQIASALGENPGLPDAGKAEN